MLIYIQRGFIRLSRMCRQNCKGWKAKDRRNWAEPASSKYLGLVKVWELI